MATGIRPHLDPFDVQSEIAERHETHRRMESCAFCLRDLSKRDIAPEHGFKRAAHPPLDVIQHEGFKESVYVAAHYRWNTDMRTVVQCRGPVVCIEKVNTKSRNREGSRFASARQ